MPGAHCLASAEENKLWADKELQETVKHMWAQIAEKYLHVGEFLHALHTYDPLLFTHQHAAWSKHTEFYDKDVDFP